MSQIIEIKVPDIGDFKDVTVIEVMVKAGDNVEQEQSLITMETDKATMDVPSPAAGVVKAVKVKVGDKVSEGSVILLLKSRAAVAPVAGTGTPAVQPATPSAPLVEVHVPVNVVKGDLHAEVVVLGAGPGGYTAAFRAADLGKQVVLIEKYATLGGVCLNVGCIPSKALLHVAKVITEAEEVAQHGVTFGKPKIDINQIRAWKESVVAKLTGGLAGLAKQRKVQVVHGIAKFTSPNSLSVETNDGSKTITFDNAIIAAGSS
ncbi:MAG: FAD-dependent oxidoreductase, partial [Betaproteobacteria bacterium]|nr:FAD-dependent oxidoreductase [Betaproteobacteria bacterium]